MSYSPSSSAKCCANCANWAGPRTMRVGGVETPAPDVRGKCYHNVGCVTPGPNACSGSNCDKFQKWGALK